MSEPRMLIDGRLVEGARTYPNVNPATEQTIGVAADATPDDVRSAVAAAKRAFEETAWATDHAFRRNCLEQLQAALEAAKEEYRGTLVAEVGTPVALTHTIQLQYPIEWLTFAAGLATDYDYIRELPVNDVFFTRNRGLVYREPVGVVGAITPFNFPLYLSLAKVGPALAAGCTVVLKPAPDTPWSGTLLGRLVAEQTDIPAGVFNVVTGSGPEAGEALTTDPRVDMITFTGSTATGARIMAACASSITKCFLELGGKSANIVLDDADLGTALGLAAAYICTHSGQGCALYTRLLLPRSRYEEGLEIATAAFAGMRCGDPADPGTLHGPQISARQRERVLGYIEKGKTEARLLAGGGIPAYMERGFYVEPTLFADVAPDSVIAREEIFGPVLVVIPYEDDDDAVRIANASDYGLSGAVWSADTDRALSVARRVRTGTMSVNGAQWIGPDRPFGGYKRSGIGRENGLEGFEEYLQTKVVGVPAT